MLVLGWGLAAAAGLVWAAAGIASGRAAGRRESFGLKFMTDLDGAQVAVSEYFLSHPGRVLGEMRTVRGAYRAGDLGVVGDEPVAPALARVLGQIVADALAICLDACGEVRLTAVARLLGVDTSQARQELGALVFDEPATGRLVPAAEYLSGMVRDKRRGECRMSSRRLTPRSACRGIARSAHCG